MFGLFFYSAKDISSIFFSSSSVNEVFSIAFILSKICIGFEAPIKTLVTMPS